MPVADCLVLRIVEQDSSAQKEDTDLYIVYDSYHSVFLLRGKRSDTPNVASRPYSFESYSLDAVIAFVSYIIPVNSQCTFELYSYPNLAKNKDEITFDELRNARSPSHEVIAYLNQTIVQKQLRKILSILCEITNDYEPDYDAQWEELCDRSVW
jgi:hypothetical protein